MSSPLSARRRVLRWAPAAVVTSLVVAGCGSSADESGSSTSAGTSATASASSTVSSSAASSSAASTGSQATPAIVAAANAFLDSLSADEKSSVLFAADDTDQKQNWSNLPTGLYERSGLAIGDMTDAQVTAFLAVMSTTLSTTGYQRVMEEWAADDALAASSGGGGGMNYGKQYYYVAIIGDPSETDSWQWQFGGHHVTVNATVHGDDLSLTPSFIGAQPSSYTANGTTVQPLGDIDETAFALVQSLDSTQAGKAVLGDSFIDLVLGPGQDCKTIASEGIAGADLTADQQSMLLSLLDSYGGLANDEDAASREAQLESDLATTTFAWYGPTSTGSAAYFRVTGPHVVIEYSPQSMGGDATDHIHGIYRDPTNDYGGTVCSS